MDRQVAVGTLVGQLMDQGRVTMECEDDRLILGEQSIVISVRQEMCIRDSLLTFQHRAGVSSYTSSFDLAQTCGFGKQLPGPILCGSLS